MAKSTHGGDLSERNRLLSKVPLDVVDRLRPYLQTVDLNANEVLYEPDSTIDYIYFLTSGIVSKRQTTEEDADVELGMIGNEGLVGACVVFGGNVSLFRSTVRIPGRALRMSAERFKKATHQYPVLDQLVRHYIYEYINMVSQVAACNSLHPLVERCCRLLLMCHDRVDADRFALTHESLAMMLGVTRPTVSTVARDLKKAGLIDYQWGEIHVRDRRCLERSACSCYIRTCLTSRELWPSTWLPASSVGPTKRAAGWAERRLFPATTCSWEARTNSCIA